MSRPSRRTADDGASLGRGLKARKSVAISEDVSFLSASEDLSYTGARVMRWTMCFVIDEMWPCISSVRKQRGSF